MHAQTNNRPTARISIMMFLQFFVWGSWFVTLFLVLENAGAGSIIADAYGTAPVAAIIAPLFLGLVADRFFPSEKVMAFLMLAGGILMLMVPGALKGGDTKLAWWLMMGHMLCFMPTLGLGNTIAFTNLPSDIFPKVRVWGTIGWIVAGLAAGALGWSGSLSLFWMAGASAIVLGLFCFALPDTPAPSAGKPLDLRSLFMVDAFKLLAKPGFLVFIACSTLVCIPLAYYYANTSGYLANMGFEQPASAMTIGQMSEIIFMLMIPFFFRKLGVKWMILIGMGAWVARYSLFAYGAPNQVAWMLFLGIALHGVCYDFFFVTGFIYTERTAPKSIRGQAQGMLVFFTQGIGMFFGFKIAGDKLTPVSPKSGELGKAITAARDGESLTYFQQLGKMFSVDMPEGTSPQLLADASALWKTYWLFPAGMAAVVAAIFFVAFWDKSGDKEDTA